MIQMTISFNITSSPMIQMNIFPGLFPPYLFSVSRAFFLLQQQYSSTSTMATGSDRRSRDPEGFIERVYACATSVSRYPLQWGLFIGNDVFKRHHEGIHLGVCAHAQPEIAQYAIKHHLQGFPWKSRDRKCPCGVLQDVCILLSFSSPFTGYLPLSPPFLLGSTFNNYIFYKRLLFSDMLCSTPSSLSRPRCIFVIFSEIF